MGTPLPPLLSSLPQLCTTLPSQLSSTFSTLTTSLSPRLTPTPSLLESRGRSTPLITSVASSPPPPLSLRPRLRMPLPPSLRLKNLPTLPQHLTNCKGECKLIHRDFERVVYLSPIEK